MTLSLLELLIAPKNEKREYTQWHDPKRSFPQYPYNNIFCGNQYFFCMLSLTPAALAWLIFVCENPYFSSSTMHLVLTKIMSTLKKLLSEKNKLKSKFSKHYMTQISLWNLYFFSVIMYRVCTEITYILQKSFPEKNVLMLNSTIYLMTEILFCENLYFSQS